MRSVLAFADSFSSSMTIRVFSLNRDIHSKGRLENVVPDELVPVRKWHSYHCSNDLSGYVQLLRLAVCGRPDYLYLNSFFDVSFSIVPFLICKLLSNRTKIVLAPRGEFSALALKIKSYRKFSFMILARWFNLYENVVWQASTKLEKEQIIDAKMAQSQSITIAGDLFDLPTGRTFDKVFFRKKIKSNMDSGTINLCYLSRIAPIKNLEFCIDVLKDVKARVNFNIYGTIEDAQYYSGVLRKIVKLPKNINVCYHGPISREQLETTLNKNCLFFLPTFGENFGHAIFEAFCFGLPVLTSTNTPWRGLEAQGCGWDIPLPSRDEYVSVIERFARLSIKERVEMAHCATIYSKKAYPLKVAYEQNRRLFWAPK